MAWKNRVDFAQQSFAKNRKIAERNLSGMREYARHLLNFRHNRGMFILPRWFVLPRYVLWPFYFWYKHKLVPELKQTHWKIQFYRKVERDLERGDLASAIEALSMFAPREETMSETIHRIRTTPATLTAIQRSPHILRENMLRLRDELLKIQQAQTC